MRGTYFCQQNGVSGVCAHAALRMLLNTHFGAFGVKLTDATVNKMLGIASGQDLRDMVSGGLDTAQISTVLQRHDRSYQAMPIETGKVDYVSFLLSLLESNSPGAIVFEIEGQDAKHIIPVFGHTFNSDLWYHEAEYAYHEIGQKRYYPHSNWIPSFIVHDDNFGMYYCMAIDSLLGGPATERFAKRLKAVYAFGFLREGVERTGRNAAEMSSLFVDSLASLIMKEVAPRPKNLWLQRLAEVCDSRTTLPVIRTLLVSRSQYQGHLQQMLDWDFGRLEDKDVQTLTEQLPESLWMCEVSLPDLYSTNKRKLGEVLYGIQLSKEPEDCIDGFLACRLPTLSLVLHGDELRSYPNSLNGHTPLCPTAAIPPDEW